MLPECHEPFFDLLDRVRVDGTETARVHYDCRGFVAHHNTDLWADTAPLDNTLCGLWPLGGAWMALHLWDHFDYSRDLDFLRVPRLSGDQGRRRPSSSTSPSSTTGSC